MDGIIIRWGDLSGPSSQCLICMLWMTKRGPCSQKAQSLPLCDLRGVANIHVADMSEFYALTAAFFLILKKMKVLDWGGTLDSHRICYQFQNRCMKGTAIVNICFLLHIQFYVRLIFFFVCFLGVTTSLALRKVLFLV